MAVSTVTLGFEGPNQIPAAPATISIKVAASSTGYLTASGGLPFDIAAALNLVSNPEDPINPALVLDLLPAITANGYLASGFSIGRYTAADGTVSTATPTAFTSAGTTFTAADTGYSIQIPGAGPGGATLTSVMTYVSAHAVTLSTPASTSVTAAVCWVNCPTYVIGNVEGGVTRIDSNVRPQYTLATCPAWVRLWNFSGSTKVGAEFTDGNNSDSFTALLLLARGGSKSERAFGT